jgi:hypothetical protein
LQQYGLDERSVLGRLKIDRFWNDNHGRLVFERHHVQAILQAKRCGRIGTRVSREVDHRVIRCLVKPHGRDVAFAAAVIEEQLYAIVEDVV